MSATKKTREPSREELLEETDQHVRRIFEILDSCDELVGCEPTPAVARPDLRREIADEEPDEPRVDRRLRLA